MSKRIRIRITSRRPDDSPALLKAILAASPKATDVNLENVNPEIVKRESTGKVSIRVDEQLETEVNRQLGDKLDTLAKLAKTMAEIEAVKQKAEANLILTQAQLQQLAQMQKLSIQFDAGQSEADLILQQVKELPAPQRGFTKWFTDSASAAWTTTVKAVANLMMKHSGPGS